MTYPLDVLHSLVAVQLIFRPESGPADVATPAARGTTVLVVLEVGAADHRLVAEVAAEHLVVLALVHPPSRESSERFAALFTDLKGYTSKIRCLHYYSRRRASSLQPMKLNIYEKKLTVF